MITERLAECRVVWLGQVPYQDAWSLQEQLAVQRGADDIPDTLLLLEHPPTYTLGSSGHDEYVLLSPDELRARGIEVYHVNRGGDVTYHGPGQLVGYPIFDLRSLPIETGGRMGPVDFVRQMEEALIRLCGVFGVRAGRIAGLTGVWCGLQSEGTGGPAAAGPERKIGAIGIHVSRGITSHGFAFNVTTDLRDFTLINPCGITDRPVTSLEREVERSQQLPSLEAIAHQAARQFGLVFGQQVLAVESLEALRAQAASTPESPAPVFPAEDTPLQIPAEVERLTHSPQRLFRT